jgi:RimJ/RimL family protein N-acetyltransferase
VTTPPTEQTESSSTPAPATPQRVVLETPRLLLRELVLDDAPFIASIFEDEAARRFYPEMHRLENAERWVRRNLDTYVQDGFGLWAILLKETGQTAGDCGLMRQQIDGDDEIEVGYHLHASFRGRGVATEAARACIEWGFANLPCTRIVSMVHPKNHASRAVCKRVHKKSRRFWRHGARYFLFFTER